MSKDWHSFVLNSFQIPDRNSSGGGCDDSKLFEVSELDSATDEATAVGADDYMYTYVLRRLFFDFVMADSLVVMRCVIGNGTRSSRSS